MNKPKLHIVCGCCGKNDKWTYSVGPGRKFGEKATLASVILTCNGCDTAHDLGDFVLEKGVRDKKGHGISRGLFF